MKLYVYLAKCLTNLHMGSGDVNYSVIDQEVERDPVLGEAVMNSSGIKGALRDYCEKNTGASGEEIEYIFGSRKSGGQPGQYVFFAGDLLARPIRVSGGRGNSAYVLATTEEMIRHFADKCLALGVDFYNGPGDLPQPPEGGGVPCGVACDSAEGLRTAKTECAFLSKLLGTNNWALLLSRQLAEIDLPVVARNVLDNGISKNLWYEEIVPHESVFGILIGAPDGDEKLDKLLGKDPVVQFGAGASIGNGFVRLERWPEQVVNDHE